MAIKVFCTLMIILASMVWLWNARKNPGPPEAVETDGIPVAASEILHFEGFEFDEDEDYPDLSQMENQLTSSRSHRGRRFHPVEGCQYLSQVTGRLTRGRWCTICGWMTHTANQARSLPMIWIDGSDVVHLNQRCDTFSFGKNLECCSLCNRVMRLRREAPSRRG